MNLSKYRPAAVILLGLLLMAAVPAGLAADNQGRIAFIHCVIDSTGVVSSDISLAPGRVKEIPRTPEPNGLMFELITSDGTIMESGYLDNPLIKKYEYEDPDNPGRLLSKIVHLEKAHFMLRVNVTDHLDHIAFYRLSGEYDSSRRLTKSKELGSIYLNKTGEDR
jgi:hypothetical protein